MWPKDRIKKFPFSEQTYPNVKVVNIVAKLLRIGSQIAKNLAN